MKKVLMIAAFTGIAMASCKKDYTCSCTNVPGFGTVDVKYEKVKKDDAETSCNTAETSYKSVAAEVNCDLK